jgi:hypothetical protein
VETDEILVVGGNPRAVGSTCPVCNPGVSMVVPQHAARIAGVSTRTIYAWVESGRLHFTESPDRSLLICLDSLSAAASSVDKATKQASS